MMLYGIRKMLLAQCVLLPFSAWHQPVDKLASWQIMWALTGYSGWFQFLLGFFEFAPSLLLFFRRTTLLGGILLFPLTLGVFLVNRAMGLWDFTMNLSAGLLLLNLAIFGFEWKRIRFLLSAVLGKNIIYPKRRNWLELKVGVLIIVVMSFGIKWYNFGYKNIELCGDWTHNRPNEWVLTAEKIADSTIPFKPFLAYFMPNGTYSEFNDSTPNAHGFIICDVDPTNHYLYFKWLRYGTNEGNLHHFKGQYRYAVEGDTCLRISLIDTPPHTWVFKKRVMEREVVDLRGR